MRASFAAMTALVVAIGAAGCSQDESTQSGHGTTTVVASTDVWGSVASAVTGDHATVTSIVSGTVADPHSFEASPADTAAITDASLVVFNGGDYDHWVEHVLEDHPNVPTVDAFALLPASSQPANEHVFYDPATAKAVATQVADRLSAIDSANADAYRANADAFGAKADEIRKGIERTALAEQLESPGFCRKHECPAFCLLVHFGFSDLGINVFHAVGKLVVIFFHLGGYE